MKKKLGYLIAIAVMLALVGGDVAAAKKNRGGAKARAKTAKARVKNEPKAKAIRGRSARRERGNKKASRRDRRVRYASKKSRSRTEIESRASRPLEAQEPTAPPPPRMVASGIPTERVIEIQNALIKSGHFPGPASGQYDESTADAMKRFQTFNKLPATGLPSAHTLKKLGVSKRSNDGYAAPVNSVSEREKKP
jgi:hypothetical protein